MNDKKITSSACHLTSDQQEALAKALVNIFSLVAHGMVAAKLPTNGNKKTKASTIPAAAIPRTTSGVITDLKERTMSNERTIRKSDIVGSVGAVATFSTAASTASAVMGGSAATIMSATAGTTSAALASTFGASGLVGAAATTSGMATVGSVVGGSMAAGAIITAAAPIAVIGAVAYGISSLFD